MLRFVFWFLTEDGLENLSAANAVLEGACERVIVGDLYCDIPLGLYVIRGENVVLIGEVVSRMLYDRLILYLLLFASSA